MVSSFLFWYKKANAARLILLMKSQSMELETHCLAAAFDSNKIVRIFLKFSRLCGEPVNGILLNLFFDWVKYFISYSKKILLSEKFQNDFLKTQNEHKPQKQGKF